MSSWPSLFGGALPSSSNVAEEAPFAIRVSDRVFRV